jgi:hypothetical protein
MASFRSSTNYPLPRRHYSVRSRSSPEGQPHGSPGRLTEAVRLFTSSTPHIIVSLALPSYFTIQLHVSPARYDLVPQQASHSFSAKPNSKPGSDSVAFFTCSVLLLTFLTVIVAEPAPFSLVGSAVIVKCDFPVSSPPPSQAPAIEGSNKMTARKRLRLIAIGRTRFDSTLNIDIPFSVPKSVLLQPSANRSHRSVRRGAAIRRFPLLYIVRQMV